MSTTSNYNIKHTTYWLCITAMFMALNIVMSSFSIPEYAMLKLPYQILQAVVGAVAGMILCWKCKLVELFHQKVFRKS